MKKYFHGICFDFFLKNLRNVDKFFYSPSYIQKYEVKRFITDIAIMLFKKKSFFYII